MPQKLELKPRGKLAFLHLHFTRLEVSGFTEWVPPPMQNCARYCESLLKDLSFTITQEVLKTPEKQGKMPPPLPPRGEKSNS